MMDMTMQNTKPHSISGTIHHGQDALDLVVYWRMIAKRKWNILGLAAAITLLATVIVFMMTPIYRSTVTLLIEQKKAKVLSIEEVYGGVGESREHFLTQSEIIKSQALAGSVVDKLALTTNPEFDPRQHKSFLASALSAVGIGEGDMSEEAARKIVVDKFMKRVTVEPIRLSQLVKVSFESPDRELAAKVANAIAETYIESDMDSRYQMAQKAEKWLSQRLVELRTGLERSEHSLQKFREREHIVDTKNLALSGDSSQLEGLVKSLVEARMHRAEAESAYIQVKNGKGDPESLPVVLKNPLVARLKEVVGDHERKVSELSNRYGKQHVKMIQAVAELHQARENLRHQISDVVSGLAREYEVARANEKALSDAVGETRTTIQGTNRKEFKLAELESDVSANRQIYGVFLSRFKETNAASDMQSGVVARIVDPAVPADNPAKPDKLQVILTAFALGLFVGMIAALLMERLDNTIKTTEDAETRLGQPVLATIPLLEGDKSKAAGRHYLDEPKSIFSEGIRTARTGILLSAVDCPNKVLVVTSSVPGEGKSTFAINLALSHAQTKKVLLIDADMRRPTVARNLDLDASKPGLSMLVTGDATLKDCVQTVAGSSLQAIAVGNIPPNPLELVLSQKFRELLDSLRKQYDIVILDTPPVQLVSDAVVMSTMATGVVFVVKADSTPYQVASRCIRTLIAAEANLFGVTLNQLDFKKAERYYGAYTGYASYGADGYYAKAV